MRTVMTFVAVAILRMGGTTAIFMTHHQEEALFMGDRVAVQTRGRIEQVGTPDEAFGSPATRFVAAFMGETDFLPGEVTSEGVQTELGMLQPGNEVNMGARVPRNGERVSGAAAVRAFHPQFAAPHSANRARHPCARADGTRV